MWDAYHFPESVTEALDLLAAYDGGARVIAGGTDLVLELERNPGQVRALVDISRLRRLQQIEYDEKTERITIAAGVSFSQILRSPLLARAAPHLLEAAETIAGWQIRNVATLCGNVVNASPAADAVPPLYTLEAAVHVASAEQERIVPIEAFVRGVRCVDLQQGEMVTAISFPRPAADWRNSFRKVGLRRSMAIAVVGVAMMILVREHKIADVRIALGSVAPTVVRASEAEEALCGLSPEDALVSDAARQVQAAVSPIDDFRASAAYRRQVTSRLVAEQLQQLLEID